MFSCEDCVFFRQEGWATFAAADGTPIRQGPCWQRSFYNYEAARLACDGRDKKEK